MSTDPFESGRAKKRAEIDAAEQRWQVYKATGERIYFLVKPKLENLGFRVWKRGDHVKIGAPCRPKDSEHFDASLSADYNDPYRVSVEFWGDYHGEWQRVRSIDGQTDDEVFEHLGRFCEETLEAERRSVAQKTMNHQEQAELAQQRTPEKEDQSGARGIRFVAIIYGFVFLALLFLGWNANR